MIVFFIFVKQEFDLIAIIEFPDCFRCYIMNLNLIVDDLWFKNALFMPMYCIAFI